MRGETAKTRRGEENSGKEGRRGDGRREDKGGKDE